MAFTDRNLKVGQVQFAERPLIHNGIIRHPVHFLRVGGKMLRTRADPHGLDAPDAGRSHFSGQVRIF